MHKIGVLFLLLSMTGAAQVQLPVEYLDGLARVSLGRGGILNLPEDIEPGDPVLWTLTGDLPTGIVVMINKIPLDSRFGMRSGVLNLNAGLNNVLVEVVDPSGLMPRQSVRIALSHADAEVGMGGIPGIVWQSRPIRMRIKTSPPEWSRIQLLDAQGRIYPLPLLAATQREVIASIDIPAPVQIIGPNGVGYATRAFRHPSMLRIDEPYR